MVFTLDQIWAKAEPFQSIRTHSCLTGVVAQQLMDNTLPQGLQNMTAEYMNLDGVALSRWIGYLASLHDIGKIECQFQWKNEDSRQAITEADLKDSSTDPAAVRHELTTRSCLRGEIWKETRESRDAIRFFADLLGAHHQGKTGRAGSICREGWSKLRADFELEMRCLFLEQEEIRFPRIERTRKGPLGAVLLGIVIMADWIASSELFSDAEDWFQTGNGQEDALRRIHQFLGVSGLLTQHIAFQPDFTSVWPDIPRNGLRGLQEETESLFINQDERFSLLLLEAPMGEGKTEAGVYAAVQMAQQWGKEGFYIGLPTAATSNQMVGRMRLFLKAQQPSTTVRLLHSTAWLVDEQGSLPRFQTEEERFAASWLLPMRRGLLSNYAVGTVDQAMMSVLLVKYGALRLLGLAGKVLIIDELHAYDVYMSEILQRLLEWCKALKIPVVLLSATLTPEKKRQMLSPFTSQPLEQVYPAVTAITESGKVLINKVNKTEKRYTLGITLCTIRHQTEKIAELAIRHTEQGGCICVLLNTVQQAQDVYRAVRALRYDGKVLLFHARFPVERRDEIERECIRLFGKDKSNRPEKAILISTQVVEQSLDVDFDGMMTAIAPIDLLLQRAGRVFRHDETKRPEGYDRPELQVLIPETVGDYQQDEYVYPKCLLNQSIHLLREKKQIQVPEDIPRLVAEGYDSQFAPQEDLDLWMEQWMDDQVKASASTLCEISSPEKGFDPIRHMERVQFDDLESSSFLSAKTRLGEPTTRIVFLEPSEFELLEKQSVKSSGKKLLNGVDGKACKPLMRRSVSLRSKLLKGLDDRAAVLFGRKMLEGLRLYCAMQDEMGRKYLPKMDGSRLILDDEYGVLFEDGEVK